MSFGINLVGTKKGLLREVVKINSAENEQLDGVKEFLLKEIAKYPDTVRSIQIDANGHHDSFTRYLKIEVKPLYTGYAFDEEEKPKVMSATA